MVEPIETSDASESYRWSKVSLLGDIVSSFIRSNFASDSILDCCVSFRLMRLIVFAILRAELVIQPCLLDSS